MRLFSLILLFQLTLSVAWARPKVSFVVSKGVSSKRSVDSTTIQTKVYGKLYSIEVKIPEGYQAHEGGVVQYTTEAQKQLSVLKQAYQTQGVLNSSKDAEWAALIIQSLKAHSQSKKVVTELALEPLLPHSIFQIMAIPDQQKTVKDVIDTRSISLLAALSTSCKLVKYPLKTSSAQAFEYGVWCDHSSYAKGLKMHTGVLIPNHPKLVYPNLQPSEVYIWEDNEALKLAFGQKAQSHKIDSSKTAPKHKKVLNSEEEIDPQSPIEIDRDSSQDIFYILGGMVLLIILGIGMYNSHRKKRVAFLKKDLQKVDEEF